MDELGPEARALLALVADGHEPPTGASERVWQAVSTDLASGMRLDAGRVADRPALAGHGSFGFMSKVIWALALIGGIGAGMSMRSAWRPEVSRDQPPTAMAIPLAAPELHDVPRASVGESAAATDPHRVSVLSQARATPPRPARSADTLLQEVAALRKASDVLANEQPEQALILLRAHERRFKSGMLGEERQALTLLARCALDAHATLASARTFIARTPNAIMRGRIEKACGLGEE
jgi:hypothetical protein